MNRSKHVAWFLVALSLLGNVGVVHQQPWGMGCWVVANIGWVIHHIRRKDNASAALFGAYLALSIWGLFEWLH